MDMDIEVEEFKKKNAPSLIGSSIRDSSDKVPTLNSISSQTKPFVKEDLETDIAPVEEIIEEGGLAADEEDEELDQVLDNDGHVKKDVIEDDKADFENNTINSNIPSTELKKLNVEEDKIDDSNKVTILGGAADKYLVPASGSSSNYSYSLKQKRGSNSYDVEDSSNSLIEPDKMRSVDDIINVVNKGDFEKASTLIDDKVAQSISSTANNNDLSLKSLHEVHEPVVPDSAIENDSLFIPPAAMREGSESRLLEEQRSRSRSSHDISSGTSSNPGRPNLARGDSIHSGLHDGLSITNSYDQTSHALVSERRPRHDPSSSYASSTKSMGSSTNKITNPSSLNYLRSISRSRSRMANDRKALGDDHLDSVDLRKSGALINDDSMSNRSDIEYAVTKALDFVEDTHSVRNGRKLSDTGDIVKNLQQGLAEVAEESDKEFNAGDLLDQLANSAKELMLDDNDDNEKDESVDKNDKEERKNEVGQKDELTEIDGVNKDLKHEANDEFKEKIVTEPEDKDNVVNELKHEIEVSSEEAKEEKETKEEDVEKDVKNSSKTIHDENPKAEQSKEEKPEEEKSSDDHHEVSGEKLSVEIKNDINEKTNSDSKEPGKKEEQTETIEGGIETTEKQTKCDKTEKNNEDKHLENKLTQLDGNGTDSTCKVEGSEKESEKNLEVKPPTVSDNGSEKVPVVGRELDQETNNENQEKTGDENDNLDSKQKIIEKSEEALLKPIEEDDDIDTIIAAAAREKALKETYKAPGNDGSVFVPKNDKMTFEDEPVYLYTSFAGGFQVTTRTNRLVTILAANRIKFEYRDLGTDEEAKKVWRRYSAGKTLPGIVRGKDDFIGNWQDIEEANEDYRVRSLIYETY